MTRFPNYLEANSREEIDARIGAFVPLEFVYETLNKGQETSVQTALDGARADVGVEQLRTVLEEVADRRAWEFHPYADGTSGFVAESEDRYCMVHLLKAENGTSLTTVVIKADRHQEFPDWFLTIDAGSESIKVECSKFDPYENRIPDHDGSEFTFSPIPPEWLAKEEE